MKKYIIPTILLLAAAGRTPAETPVEVVARIGDKLVRETPFRYRLTLDEKRKAFDDLHFVDFGRSFGLGAPAVAYACTELTAESDTAMRIEVEHSDACTIWCNGDTVYHRRGQRALRLTREERSMGLSFAFDVALKRGRNRLLVKSETAGREWCVFIQPPSLREAVQADAVRYPAIGLDGMPDVDRRVADLSRWLIVGPFPAGTDSVWPPEREFRFGQLYSGVSWTIPKVEILGDVIDPAPWGTAYQWNYHNGGVAWAMQQLAEMTGRGEYARWATRFCDYQLEGLPFVKYQVNELNAIHSANHYILNDRMLDFTLAPALPFIYRLRTDSAFANRRLYQSFVDGITAYARTGQIRSPNLRNYTRETPERYTTWTDDMFMGIPFLMQAGLYAGTAAERAAFFDDAAEQVLDFTKHVWDNDAKLFMHAALSARPDVKMPHWSRANGWAIWAMTEVLMHLPAKHPRRKAILDLYRTHVRSLVRYQNAGGYWHNVVDRPESPEEVSGTAIFTMAIARGITHGWIDRKTYEPVVRRAWNAIASEVEADGTVHKICVGTMCSEDVNYYINRPLYDDDTHGSFAVIFAGMEVQRAVGGQARPAPVRLGAEEIAFLKKDLKEMDREYDPAMKMLAYTVRAKHYHSD
ncbi:MAG: glycoside hydrolase family 88 protein, partial [Tannerella sp.]|nr:glycoside hydrolase family 88 protein [Tannerella sp.]